jgi:prepilin-type N-terminal cleavage/methylation domain-containing protein
MRYPSGHKTNSAGGSRRSTTAGRRPAHRVQDSGFGAWSLGGSSANCKLQNAKSKLETKVGSGQWTVSRGHRETASGFLHPSSFIPHRSSLIAHPSPFRRGVTLVEMLVVISIIVILTVASLKLIAPGEERRVREAARAVNVYLSSARSRAIEIGRVCGVIFRRSNGTNFSSASTLLEQCELPPLYAGDETNSVVRVQDWTLRPDGQPYYPDGSIILKVQIKNNQFSSNLLHPGDLMQLNGQGPYYSLIYDVPAQRTQPPYTSPPPGMNPPSDPVVDDFPINSQFYNFNPPGLAYDSTTHWVTSHWLTLRLYPNFPPVQMLPWPKFDQSPTGISGSVWSAEIPFKILRQPMKTTAAPLRLPEGTVVDFDFSGNDYQSFQYPTGFPNNSDVLVYFAGDGSLEGYYCNNQAYASLEPIFILVGSRSRVRDFVASPLTDPHNLNDRPNWADLSSVWITINFRTGMAATDENYAVNFATQKDLNGKPIDWTVAPNWNWTNTSNWRFFINLSRTYARQSQSMGGR